MPVLTRMNAEKLQTADISQALGLYGPLGCQPIIFILKCLQELMSYLILGTIRHEAIQARFFHINYCI